MATATGFELSHRVGMENNTAATEANQSGVSWAAVTGGAFVSASLSLTLLALGAGLGFSSVSPWSNVGVSASALGMVSILWLITMQIVSSSLGGYLAGRLRTKWATVHSDEVHFRDTAHGLLVWSVGLVITAAFLTSAATTLVGGSSSSASPAVGGRSATTEAAVSDPIAYYVDSLFRSERQSLQDNAVHNEASRIFSAALSQKDISPPDRIYLVQLVAGRTGLNSSEADKRVSEVLVNARQSIEVVRKSAAHLLLWLFIALLIGAFCASFAATLGGRHRDLAKTM